MPTVRHRLVGSSVLLLALLGLVAVAGRGRALVFGVPAFEPLYGWVPPEIVAEAIRLDTWFAAHAALAFLHLIPAAGFLILALLQFSSQIRARHPAFHRWSGRLILVMAIPLVLSGLVLSAMAPHEGLGSRSAVGLFGAWVVLTIVQGYRSIRRRDTARHREWMIRLFASGLGASSVRLVAWPILFLVGPRPRLIIALSFWAGLALSIALAEGWIRATRVRPPVSLPGEEPWTPSVSRLSATASLPSS